MTEPECETTAPPTYLEDVTCEPCSEVCPICMDERTDVQPLPHLAAPTGQVRDHKMCGLCRARWRNSCPFCLLPLEGDSGAAERDERDEREADGPFRHMRRRNALVLDGAALAQLGVATLPPRSRSLSSRLAALFRAFKPTTRARAMGQGQGPPTRARRNAIYAPPPALIAFRSEVLRPCSEEQPCRGGCMRCDPGGNLMPIDPYEGP